MKEWKPERIFPRSDFSYNEKKKVSEKNVNFKESRDNQKIEKKNTIAKNSETKKIQKWIPPTLEELSQKSKMKKTVNPQPVNDENNDKIKIQKSKNDLLKSYLNSLILNSLPQSVTIIRNWYWEKKIDSHRKLYILLHSLERESLIKLFEIMTPMERKQIIEIYKSQYTIFSSEILNVRQSFIEQLSTFGNQ